ncbi:hypothetical protein ARZXY2_4396 (plasmid) [Arthrobacter sp. ZXY-2]|nr:hypothetical protein ARZXY2_4396 [Arthrobacter sp. ZXY-2]
MKECPTSPATVLRNAAAGPAAIAVIRSAALLLTALEQLATKLDHEFHPTGAEHARRADR